MREIAGVRIADKFNGVLGHDTAANTLGAMGYDEARAHARMMMERGMTGYKLLTAGTNKVNRAQGYIDEGMLVAVRFYVEKPWGKPPASWVTPGDQIRPYVDVGVQLMELGWNEPNISEEWVNGPPNSYNDVAAAVVAAWEVGLARAVEVPGLIPLFPAHTPSGATGWWNDHRAAWTAMKGMLEAKGLMGTVQHVACHPRPLNNPPDTPWTASNTCTWNEWEWFRANFAPNAYYWATEHGYSFGDDQNHDWPQIDLAKWEEYNWELFMRMNHTHPKAHDPHMAGAFYWIQDTFGYHLWRKDALIGSYGEGGMPDPSPLWQHMLEHKDELAFTRYGDGQAPTNVAFTFTPASPAVHQTVAFSGSASGEEPLSYFWSFGDSGNGTGKTTQHGYGVVGTYDATLTVSNTHGQQTVHHPVVVAAEVPTELENGIDISWYQRTGMNWAEVAEHNSFVIIRAARGLTLDAAVFGHTDQAAAKAPNVKRGYYHFLDKDNNATTQGRFFAALMWALDSDIQPALDVEQAGVTAQNVRDFVGAFESEYGTPPAIYTRASFWNALGDLSDVSARCPLWVANWDVAKPTLPRGWTDWLIWQHTIAVGPEYPTRIDRDKMKAGAEPPDPPDEPPDVPPGEIAILDASGNPKDWAWLTATFGLTAEYVQQGTEWRITKLQEGGPSSSLLVYGPPGTVVKFGWPDGEVSGTVEPKGFVGFGMGNGAYYFPPNTGPHYVEVGDCRITGLGMLGGTEHRHIDVTVAPA